MVLFYTVETPPEFDVDIAISGRYRQMMVSTKKPILIQSLEWICRCISYFRSKLNTAILISGDFQSAGSLSYDSIDTCNLLTILETAVHGRGRRSRRQGMKDYVQRKFPNLDN